MTLLAFAAEHRAAAQLLLGAGCAAINRYLLPAGRQQQTHHSGERMMGGTDRQTEGRSTVSYTLLCILCKQSKTSSIKISNVLLSQPLNVALQKLHLTTTSKHAHCCTTVTTLLHTFNGLFSRTTWVSLVSSGKRCTVKNVAKNWGLGLGLGLVLGSAVKAGYRPIG